MAFSEKLRDSVKKSRKIGHGLWKDFVSNPVKRFLHWSSIKGLMPSLMPVEGSRLRKLFDQYLGYEQHRVKFDEDFWKRRQGDKNSVLEVEWKNYKLANPKTEESDSLGETMHVVPV